MLVCLLASSVCMSVNADARGPGIIFDSSLSHEGDLIILAIEQPDPHPDSAHLSGLACFVNPMTEFCLSQDLFV